MDCMTRRERRLSQATIEQALEYYQRELQMVTEEGDPVQRAVIQQQLCDVYLMRCAGEESENLQQVITRGQAALAILTRRAQPLVWAEAHACLGEAYRLAACTAGLEELYSGQAVMQEQALRHLEAALEVYDPHEHPFAWAKVQRSLCLSYRQRIRGERDENLACARHCYQNASQVFSCEFCLWERTPVAPFCSLHTTLVSEG